jgi:hypothetical protein
MEPRDWEAEYLNDFDARMAVEEIAPIAKSTVKRRGLPISLLDGTYHQTPSTPRREKSALPTLILSVIYSARLT